MRISVIGTGYVGLVSGTCLAAKGHEVTCVDISQQRVDDINAKIPPIHEDGLPELLDEVVGVRLNATTELTAAVHGSDVSLIAVGTPYKGDQIDLQYIRAAATQIGEALATKDGYHVVLVKSTVVPGTTEDVVLPALEAASGKQAGADFGVGMNPEFLREGAAIPDFMHPDRIVLGGIDERTLDVLEQMYAVFPDADKVRTNPKTAEMIKYTANSLLATLISFANEVGNMSTEMGDIDVLDVMEGVHLDHRFNPIVDGERANPGFLTYLMAGCGFGGSCFPKDVKALIAHGRQHGYAPEVVDAAMRVNEAQPTRMIELLQRQIPNVQGAAVTVLGAAFKPNTDDVRESPTLAIVPLLLAAGAVVTVHDPLAEALENIEGELGGDVTYSGDLESALRDADAVMLVTSWPDYSDLASMIDTDAMVVIDGRRVLDKAAFARYEGIGV